MMCHVHSAICRRAGELRKPEEPSADEIIDLLVAEQQSVRCFVHERRELRMCTSHENERNRYSPRGEFHGDPENYERLYVHENKRHRIPK